MASLSYECKNLVLFNFITPSEVVEKYVPAHTKLDYYNGHCLISLVGFQMTDLAVNETKIPLQPHFEQIGLQFYVKRFDGAHWKQGTVYISKMANKKLINALANSIFNETFLSVATASKSSQTKDLLFFEYNWLFQDKKQEFKASTKTAPILSEKNSEEEFLLERSFIYAKYSKEKTSEYKLSHPRWRIFPVVENYIDVDFSFQFGAEFSHLTKPHSVVVAQGSSVHIEDLNFTQG